VVLLSVDGVEVPNTDHLTNHSTLIIKGFLDASNAPKPIRTFEEAAFPDYIIEDLERAGLDQPTPIQAQGWPIALSGCDLVGIAETGSGKTLAFFLPAIVHINAQSYLSKGDGPIALVMVPTRELAFAIQQEADWFGRSSKIKYTSCYGRSCLIKRHRHQQQEMRALRHQQEDLRDGVEIVIATPGRLITLLDRGDTNLKRMTFLVVDEADRMLDMGFEPLVRKITSQCRSDRQTLMWSCTWPEEVKRLARDICRENPFHVHIGSLDLQTAHAVRQHVEVVGALAQWADRRDRLFRLLENIIDGSRILIHVGTKGGGDQLTRDLRLDGWPALVIHGDQPQAEQDYVLEQFERAFRKYWSPQMTMLDGATSMSRASSM